LKNTPHIAALIMAAGASQRMEGIKQLLPWKNSNFLLETSKTVRNSTADSIFVVLGSSAEEINTKCNLVEKGLRVVMNPSWANGLGNSIAVGVKEVLQKQKEVTGILICLADQPLLSTDYLNAIIQQFEKNPTKIVATDYGKKVGVPALFPKLLFDELVRLEGDQGAKDLLNNSTFDIIRLEGKNQIKDIDTKEEYDLLLKQFTNQ